MIFRRLLPVGLAACSALSGASELEKVDCLVCDGDGGSSGDATGTDDASGGGDAASDSTPASCHALFFNGAAWADVSDAADLDGTGPTTMEAWVRREADDVTERHILSHHAHFDRKGYLLMAYGPPGSPAMLGASARYYSETTLQIGFGGQSPITQNKWTHVASTFDGNEARIYVDGVLKDQAVATKKPPAHDFAGPLRIGASAENQEEFNWKGAIDEVRLSRVSRYSTNFTPPERHTLDSDTIALLHFDEGKGTTARDESPAAHHATISGATWVDVACAAR